MYMRFGPLGHQGGERRLNVAITRAKDNVKLVGSIMPYDIDLDKTKSEGVRMLRDYMEFAIKGNSALKPYKNPSNLYDKDMFCDSICLFLSKKGYTVKQYVGTSSYKIDIAVEHPKHQGCYVAGIECDGNSYYVSRTTRDREHLRKTILENMGWKMFRIWSTEWINNRESEEQRMLDFINEAIVSYEKGEQRQEQSLPKKSDNVKVEVVQKKVEEPTKLLFPYYQVGDWRTAEYNPYKGNLENIASRIRAVVKVEQPIHLDVLYRRLASAFGNEKATKPVRETINLSLKRVMSNEVVIEDGFVRFKEFTDIRARIPKGVQDRNIEYISKPEIADAMKAVIKNSYGITREDLCVETTSIFGYDRMGPKISKAMNEAIEYMLRNNMVYIIDSKMHIKED
jgi:very-short-patch-repair endonuclease